jgi:hypothetical protein
MVQIKQKCLTGRAVCGNVLFTDFSALFHALEHSLETAPILLASSCSGIKIYDVKISLAAIILWNDFTEFRQVGCSACITALCGCGMIDCQLLQKQEYGCG